MSAVAGWCEGFGEAPYLGRGRLCCCLLQPQLPLQPAAPLLQLALHRLCHAQRKICGRRWLLHLANAGQAGGVPWGSTLCAQDAAQPQQPLASKVYVILPRQAVRVVNPHRNVCLTCYSLGSLGGAPTRSCGRATLPLPPWAALHAARALHTSFPPPPALPIALSITQRSVAHFQLARASAVAVDVNLRSNQDRSKPGAQPPRRPESGLAHRQGRDGAAPSPPSPSESSPQLPSQHSSFCRGRQKDVVKCRTKADTRAPDQRSK